MPFDSSKSGLAKKYGSKRVAMARNLVMAKLGLPLNSDKYKDKLPWGIIGKIAQNSHQSGKDVSMADIEQAKIEHKRYGVEPSLKSAHKKLKIKGN